MAEENDNILDIQGAQNYLNELLDNNPTETPTEEVDDEKNDERLSAREAELLKNAANIEDIEEELDPKQVQKLLDFVGGEWTDMNPDELKDEDLERLTKIAVVKAEHFNYRPKKTFGVEYKKNRNRKNRTSKRSRALNRK